MVNAIETYAGATKPRNAQGEFFGVYPGVVEYNNDPSQTGKIKVRVPGVTGFAKDFSTDLIPWANPCFPFGGGFDYGSIMVPPIGSSVWVLFIGGDPHEPVWIGTFPGIPTIPKKMLRDQKGDWPKGPVSMSPDKDTTWIAPPGPNAPSEFLEQVNHRPEHYVPFKSPKGASIDIEDRDEVEKFSINDRTGQGLFLEAPVKVDYNKGNALQRGLSSASIGLGFPVETTLADESRVSLIDLGGQTIDLYTKKNANKILISSKENEEETEGTLKVTYGGNKEISNKSQVYLELNGSEGKFKLEVIKNNVGLALFTIDGSTGAIELDSNLEVRISSENIVLNGDVEIQGDLLTSGNVVSLGDHLVCGAFTATEDRTKNSLTEIEQPTV